VADEVNINCDEIDQDTTRLANARAVGFLRWRLRGDEQAQRGCSVILEEAFNDGPRAQLALIETLAAFSVGMLRVVHDDDAEAMLAHLEQLGSIWPEPTK
jgi:hypothetical protein